MTNQQISIRPEEKRDDRSITSLILRSFREGTSYSDGTDVVALAEEIRVSPFYLPELSFVAEKDGQIVGHFMFSRFPLAPTPAGGCRDTGSGIVLLAPVSVHADYFRQGIGTAMLTKGIENVRRAGFRGILVEGNFSFYNRFGFRTSSEFGIYPTSGYPLQEPRCMMARETFPGSMAGVGGFVVYDMYHNA
ncbi:MAG: GNAT family N-acetyltransferase [Aristaeellaceae bacterium]